MIDVIERLQRAETRPLAGTESWVELWQVLSDARAEIARLRSALEEQAGRASWNYDCLTRCEERVIQRDAEIARLRLAIRRLADQDATLSVVGGNVIVEMDATLTDAEREAVRWGITLMEDLGMTKHPATLRGLLERMGCKR